jgi:hypothetical protein
MSMKNENQTRNLPACSAVPQPTAPPCTPRQIDSSLHFNIRTEMYTTLSVPFVCVFEICRVSTLTLQKAVVGSCECGNEPSAYRNGGEFPE